MDFEKAYQNFLNNTATEEEIEFVRAQLNAAKEVGDTLDKMKDEKTIADADREDVKKAVRKYNLKDTIKILTVVLLSVLVIAIVTVSAVVIPVLNTAKDNQNYTMEDAVEIATECVLQRYPENYERIKVYKTEKELEVEGRLKNARYIYIVDVYNGVNNVVEIEIDAKTGAIIETDWD